MMYELFLIDGATKAVADHLFIAAEDRAEALARRPESWPISRTRAARLRLKAKLTTRPRHPEVEARGGPRTTVGS